MIPNKNWRKLFFLKPRATLSHTSNRKKLMCVIFFYFALSFFSLERDNLCGIDKDPYRMVKIYDSWNHEDLCILILIVNDILFFFFTANPCELFPCLNSGCCVQDRDTFKCLCPEQYAGSVCGEKGDSLLQFT